MVVLASLFVSQPAYAEPGDGVQNEYFILHAGIDLLSGVNTNVFFQDSNEASRPGAAAKLLIQPNLKINNQEGTSVDFDLDWRMGWRQYLSGDDSVSAQSGLNTVLGAGVTLNPRGNFSLRIEDQFIRTNEAPNEPTPTPINRIVNRLGGTLGIHPGGRVFQGYVSYHWSLFDYSEQLSSLNKDSHDLQGRFIWQFLPKTALLLNADYSIINYDEPFRRTSRGVPTALANVNSSPLRIQAGLSGLITNGLSLTLLGGWGWGFYDAGASPSRLLITSQLAYQFGPARKSKAYVGYTRGFRDAPLGNYFEFDLFNIGVEQLLSNDDLRIFADVSFNLRDAILSDAGPLPLADGGTALLPPVLADTLLNTNVGVSYNFTRWFDAGVNYMVRANFSDSNVELVAGEEEISGRSFVQHIILARVGFRY
jgi:hypothetical protein